MFVFGLRKQAVANAEENIHTVYTSLAAMQFRKTLRLLVPMYASTSSSISVAIALPFTNWARVRFTPAAEAPPFPVLPAVDVASSRLGQGRPKLRLHVGRRTFMMFTAERDTRVGVGQTCASWRGEAGPAHRRISELTDLP